MSAKRQIRDDLIGTKFTSKNGLITINRYVKYNEIYASFDETGHEIVTTLQRLNKGAVRDPLGKNFSGVGYIGLGKYKTMVNWVRPTYYTRWESMISRCYSETESKDRLIYADCLVEESWRNLQNYAKWYTEHPYRNDSWEIDKDILFKGNKVYSEDTCIFVPKYINTMFTKCNKWRGDLPLGVYPVGKNGYKMICSDSLDGKVSISGFKSVESAFAAYKDTKEKIIKKVANIYKPELEPRAYEALIKYQVEITD